MANIGGETGRQMSVICRAAEQPAARQPSQTHVVMFSCLAGVLAKEF
jgi:hypothetical protein